VERLHDAGGDAGMTMDPHTLAPTRDATVVADIGGDVGALVLYTAPEMCGVEIDIEPVGHPERRSHVAVRERQLASGSVFAAFYPALTAGEHTLMVPAPDGPRTVTIAGGAVTEIAWSQSVG
jgi:hypothetical protein